MFRWLSAGCIAFGFAVVLNPDVAPLVLATFAVLLIGALLVSSAGALSVALTRVSADGNATDAWSSRATTEQVGEVVHLVLLSQPRR